MRHYIKIYTIGNHPEVEIDETLFFNLENAKKTLTAALAIEEKHEILISNYVDFHKEVLSIITDEMIYDRNDYQYFFKIRLSLNRRIVNLLTSTKLYIDQIKQNIKLCTDEVSNIEVEQLFNLEYDQNFEYRFMEALRNHIQHQGLAVHSTNHSSKWIDQNDRGDKKLEFSLEAFTHKNELEDTKFKRTTLDEMPDKINLIQSTKSYISSMCRIHYKVRKMIEKKTSFARSLIEEQINSYKGDQRVGLSAIRLNDSNKIEKRISLLLDWDNVRLNLLKKNNNASNLNLRCISDNS